MHDYFEQKIKKALNDPPDFPVDEKAWENLQSRMQGKPAKGWGKMAYLVPLALLLWFLPVAFSWHTNGKLNDANNKIEHLETMLRSNATLLLDTIVQRHVTVVYDTIYRTIYADIKIEKNKTNNSPQLNDQPSYSYLYENKNPYFTALNNVPINSLFSKPGYLPTSLLGFNKNADNIKTGNIAAGKNIKLNPPANVEQLNLKPFENDKIRDLFTASPPYILKKNKKGLRYYMYKMQPTHFALAANYGMVDVSGFGAGKRDIVTGLEAAIGYGENMNLLIGAEYLNWEFKNEYEIDREENKIFEEFPEALPNSPQDELHELYGDFKYLQIPVGLEYTFNSQSRLMPYFGLGVTAQQALHSELIYEYLKPSGDDYKIQRKNLLSNTFELKSAWGSLGVQYELGEHWSLRLEGNAQFDLEKGKYKYEGLQFYKLKSGLKYRF